MKFKKVYTGPGYPALSYSRLNVIVRGLSPDMGVDVRVPKALRQIEQGRLGSTEISRHFGLSVDEIKQTWKI